MRRITFLFLLLAIITAPVFGFQVNLDESDVSTLIFVRHAERAEDGTRNPPISEEGIERAMNLADVLSSNDYNLVRIYSTPYKRTQMTATPTSELFQLDIVEYGFDDLENWLSSVIDENLGKTVLIVGHSNTTPRLINMVIGEEKFDQLDEHAYGDLFIVTTDSYGSGSVEVASF
jgi:broad specificity phosphatase PhoE